METKPSLRRTILHAIGIAIAGFVIITVAALTDGPSEPLDAAMAQSAGWMYGFVAWTLQPLLIASGAMFAVGLVVGLRVGINPSLAGVASLGGYPATFLIDVTADPTSHNLAGLEPIILAPLGLVAGGAMLGAWLGGRKLRVRTAPPVALEAAPGPGVVPTD